MEINSTLIKESFSMNDLSLKVFKYTNQSSIKKLNKIISDNNYDISHFGAGKKNIKNEILFKECPVCNKKFNTSKDKNEKTTCSYACSNTFFRKGENNGNWKQDRYRTTCFLYHEKKCIICDEINIVEVHHFDENNKNNNPDNLIPMCPTHHQYWHSNFKPIIYDQVISYIENWKKLNTIH